MAKNIVVVGSCMIDFTCYSPRLPKPGETIRGKRFEITYGGKGANQCVAAARLGASTTLVASLGSDTFAQEYLEKLKNENVDISHVKIRKNAHSGIAQITVAEDGQNSIVVVTGANELLSTKQVDDAIDTIKRAGVLVCQFETPLESSLHALKHYKGNGFSIMNGAPAAKNVDPELLRLCDVFCVNETEAEMMTGVEPLSLSNAQQATDKLLSLGCNTVVVTLGALGAVYASRKEPRIARVATVPVQPVDTTGAGDAFLGALAYFKAHHREMSTDECIRRACIVATKSVMEFGAQASFPTRADLSPELFS